jgi:NAD(P)H-dependent flavin oxidoreductase YrpB (nitropropane dioxygenase family)
LSVDGFECGGHPGEDDVPTVKALIDRIMAESIIVERLSRTICR